MNKPLLLVKHSLPEIVESTPAKSWRLSKEGRVRAERLAERLAKYQPEVLISSVEPKARETAEIVGASLQLDVQIIEGLHEHDRTTSPYLARDEFRKVVQEFFLHPDDLVFGLETANEAHSRFSKVVHRIYDASQDQSIAIISHGTVISLFVGRLTGVSDFSLWNELGLPSFVVLDMNSRTVLAQENTV